MSVGQEKWGSGVGSLSDAVQQAQDLIDSLVIDGHAEDGLLGASGSTIRHGGNGSTNTVDSSTASLEEDHQYAFSYRTQSGSASHAPRVLSTSSSHLEIGEGGIHARSGNASLVEQMQRQHQQRINEMTLASARIAQQKDEEIRELSQDLAAAKSKSTSLARQVEALQQEAGRMKLEHKASLQRLEAEIVRARPSGGSGADPRVGQIGRRMQATLDAVRRAAESEIAELRRERDALRDGRGCGGGGGGGGGGGREAALIAALEAESERLAVARDEVSALTVQGAQEVAELKAKLGHIMRSTQKRYGEQDAENKRLRSELDAARGGGEANSRALAAACENLHGRILGIENTARVEVAEHEREAASLRAATKGMEEEVGESRRLCEALSEQNVTLVSALARLEHELSLSRSECDLARGEREMMSRRQEDLEREVCRLDGIVYGGKRASSGGPGEAEKRTGRKTLEPTGRSFKRGGAGR